MIARKRNRHLIFVAVCNLIALVLFVPAAKAQINTTNMIYMGRSAIASEDYLTAIRYFNQVIDVKPHLYLPYYYRAYAKFSLDDFQGAEADCTHALDINPFASDVLPLRGICRIRLNNYKGAAEDYTQALKESPDDRNARFNRGLCRLEGKEYEDAAADMDTILRRWPDFYRAYSVQAQSFLAAGDTARSLTKIDELLEKQPRNADGWSFKGRYALSQNDYAEADSLLSRSIGLQPERPTEYLARAQARHGLNRFGDAINDYDKAIALVPEHFVAHYNRGLLLALIGENNKAIADFNYVIGVEPDNILAIYNRALLRKETGDYRGAEADFTRLIKNFPHFIAGYAARAECRRKTGNIRGAVHDETMVARANLDVLYGKQVRRPIKKVRQRSDDHNLEDYEQLVSAEDNDSTGSALSRLLSDDLFGKVQNKRVDQNLLPLFRLTLNGDVSDRGYRSTAFMPEVAALASRCNEENLLLTTDNTSGGDSSLYTDKGQKKNTRSTAAEDLLIRAVHAADKYDYLTALQCLDAVEKTDGAEHCRLLVSLEYTAVLVKGSRVVNVENGGNAEETSAEDNLLRALAEARKAIALSPQSACLHYNEGCILAEMSRRQEAILSFTHALENDPSMAEAFFNRGILYWKNGQKEEAQKDLSRAGEAGLYKAYALLKQVAK